MLNHALLNDQIGFCTWPVLTMALAMLAFEPASSLNMVWCKAKQSLSFSLCFCPLIASSPRWEPLFPPESYGKHSQLHFCSPSCGLCFCLHACPSLISRSQLWCSFVLALWKLLGIPHPEKWLVYALLTSGPSFFDIMTVNMKSSAATLEQSLMNH